VHLTHLSLTNFRNFARLDIDAPGGAILLVGDNAQGKTSLLEAVYFLATFSSFQASSDRELINFLARKEPLAVCRIVADYCVEEQSHRLEVRVIQETNPRNGSSRVRKEILLDGLKRKVSEALGNFNAVLFTPQMLSVIEGSPEERRRYLDLAISQTISSYGAALSVHQRAVSQRNALLKQLFERGGDPAQLAYWDDQIATAGSRIIHARIQTIREIEHLAALTHHELTRGEEVLRLDYRPAYDPHPKTPNQYTLPIESPVDRSGYSREQIEKGFRERLIELRDEEIARGQTTIGPHRDELRFLSNTVDLGTYGSRGQVRTALLALKIAEMNWMKDKTAHWPVLLLDEVLAELDPQRRLDLLTRLSESEQAFLTTTDLDLFSPDFVKKAALWNISGGKIRE
jgi:DNA replication and repair protein RecF